MADRDPARERHDDTTISVMDWLVSVGSVVARRLRGVPASPIQPQRRS